MTDIETPTYTYPDRGSHKFSTDQWLALKALGLGYERIAFDDAIALMFLGLADSSGPNRYILTDDGRTFLSSGGNNAG
jgi:hypothetical protein